MQNYCDYESLQGINESYGLFYATAWNNVNFSVKGKVILNNVWGHVSDRDIYDGIFEITRSKLNSYDFVPSGALWKGGGYHGSVRSWKIKFVKRFGR